jgi:2TM domain
MYPPLSDEGRPQQPAYVVSGNSDDDLDDPSLDPQFDPVSSDGGGQHDDFVNTYTGGPAASAGKGGLGEGGDPGDDDDGITDFGYQDAVAQAMDRGPWRIHVTVALVASLVSFAVWFFVQMGVDAVPWFTFVLVAGVLSLSCHFYLCLRPSREWFHLHVVWFAAVNLMLFIIWDSTADFSEDSGDVAWWFYAAGGWSLFLVAHQTIASASSKSRSRTEIAFEVCKREFIVFNLYMWIMNMNMRGYPWFIIVLFSTALPLFWFWFGVYGQKRWTMLHAGTYGLVQILLFLLWAPEHGHPWFVYALLGWGVLLGVHVYFARKRASNTHDAFGSDATRSVPATSSSVAVPYVEDTRSGDAV